MCQKYREMKWASWDHLSQEIWYNVTFVVVGVSRNVSRKSWKCLQITLRHYLLYPSLIKIHSALISLRRLCTLNDSGTANCLNMCCGRGYQNLTTSELIQCNCRMGEGFKVRCDECNVDIVTHRCLWPTNSNSSHVQCAVFGHIPYRVHNMLIMYIPFKSSRNTVRPPAGRA